jgi:holo-[acyl-carrier protein] synthase
MAFSPNMNIIGHGIDIVDVLRFTRLAQDEHYLAKCFTDKELRAVGPISEAEQRLSARFAVKEAVLKALGTGLVDGVQLSDIEVALAEGRPEVNLTGQIAEIARELDVTCWHISMAHSPEYSVASAIACSES